ncbi:hypothetical protein Cni_G07150 [Canna indica]|uniref:Uncharacterized protein n=1 Tax=Canna indica TaxID=4628 RepID=A0AAQ3Q5F8_9LILI|nr:hypothetical protein Cni_G07150 [Canna indica]
MLRQVSSRSQRGKENLKHKNALQISFMIAICVWLLYQMELYDDEKKSYEGRGSTVSLKVAKGRFSIITFGRKDLNSAAGVEEQKGISPKVVEEDEEEGGAGDHKMDREEENGGAGKELNVLEDQDHQEASQKAREMNFKGDDASSEVVHIIEEVEHDEGLQEARERSFTADDESSAVGHVPQGNESYSGPGNGGIRSHGEIQNFVNNMGGYNASIDRIQSETMHNNNTAAREDKPLIVERVSPPNATGGESGNHKKLCNNNQTSNEGKVQANSTISSKNQNFFQKNFTAVRLSPTNITVLHNQTAKSHPIDGPNHTVKLKTHGDEKHNLEGSRMIIKEKADAIGRSEKSQET